ncbi:MAG: AAA domain-containing protein [Bacilli bacterium]|nr:AAA domain-containing protein [Bacilli bacterium]
MSKKYVATVMNKFYVGEDSYVFTASHVIMGEIIENNIFKDRNGNEYGPMLNSGMIKTAIPYSYFNHMEINDLVKVVDSKLPLKEQISEYEYLTKQMFYYVGIVDEDVPVCIPFNIAELKDKNVEAVSKVDAKNEYKSNPVIDSVTGESKEQEVSEVIEERDYSLEDLVIKVVQGKFSLKELKNLRKDLLENYEDLESAIETINIQLEASEAGTSAVKLKDSDKEDLPDIDVENDIDIEDLFNKVTKTLIAQDEAARRVIAEIARKEMHPKKKKEGILLTGKTGVGKTELMRLIAKYLDRPFLKIDSTQLTIPGYTGKDIEEFLWQLYVQCGNNKEKAEQAIVFFDEIDKKATGKKEDVSGDRVLDVLLPFIEGTKYDACSNTKNSTNKVEIDTSNMISVFGGAYTDVYKDLKEEKQMGFNANVEPKERKATPSDFIEKGRTKDEFIGRVAIIKLKDLDFDDIKRLMLESDESSLKIQEQIFKKLGVKVTFTDGYVNAIAKGAVDRKTGARGLNTIIDESTWEAYEEVYKKSNRGKYSEVIFDEKTVEDSSRYQLVKRKKENRSISQS